MLSQTADLAYRGVYLLPYIMFTLAVGTLLLRQMLTLCQFKLLFFASAVVKVPHFCNPLASYFYYNIFYFNTEAASFKDMKDNRTSAVMVGPTIDSLSQYVIKKTWKNVSNYLEKMGILSKF